MSGLNTKHFMIIVAFAFIGWSACAATMGIGMALTTMQATLIVHAIGAPVYFIILAWIYFKKFSYTSPLWTAIIFIAFVVVVDFILVALVILQSLDMFSSFFGTWLPFILIFAATWLTGYIMAKQAQIR
jgi:hypothetical protein